LEQYDPKAIEAKWQRVWEDARAFYVDNPEPGEHGRPKFYMLEMLPYPSGTLHMGHVLNYTLGDVLTHYHRRNGAMALRPMGFDSFGLPAENAAIREGGHPLEITERNIAGITSQMRRMGWAIDWSREISAHEPRYYRWTQWLFLKFFEHGLAYRKAAPVNWCPNDQTVLSNEHVVDGRCWRCGAVVEVRSSGSSGSLPTPTSSCATSRASTGPSARRRSSASTSADRRGRRCCSASTSSTSTSPSSRRDPTRSSGPPSS
jgi:leucyl-tRNA synthetase